MESLLVFRKASSQKCSSYLEPEASTVKWLFKLDPDDAWTKSLRMGNGHWRWCVFCCLLTLKALASLKLTAKAPENGWLEDYFPLGRPIFRGYVSFREGRSLIFRHTHPILVRSCRLSLATKWESYLNILFSFSYSPLSINIHDALWTNVLAEANPYLFVHL